MVAQETGAVPEPAVAYGGSYFAATGRPPRPRPPLTQDQDVDICVIGGGLAGLTVAHEAARRGWSVAVLEGRRVAWNASSRNAGFVLPGFGQDIGTIVERTGVDHARELWALSQAGVDHVRRLAADMRDTAMSEGWLYVSKTERGRQLADEADLLRSFGADVEFWPASLVRSKLKSDLYFQAIHHPTAFNIHPLNYAFALAELAEAAGARIYEETAALDIDPAGVRKRIVTGGGRIRAAHVVLAGNVHLGALMPEIAQTLLPIHTFAIVTGPLGEQLRDAIDYPGAVSDSDRADSHYRIVDGDRLLWTGRMTVWQARARRFGRRLRADLRRRYPQLNNVAVDHAWTGTLGLTVHRMPQIGEVSPGVWIASGFGGHGLNTTAMAGDLIARAIVEGDDRWRLFAPFEMIWAGGRSGRILMQAAYWAHRNYESFASKRSRRLELWRIREEARLAKEAEEAAVRARLRAAQEAVWEAERKERERIEAEQAEIRRIERERIAAQRAEARRIRAEQRAAARAEAARLKAERREARRLEAERRAAEKAERKRIEAERQRLEAERLAAERAEAARLEAERLAAEQAEAERRALEQAEADRREAERLAAERAQAERIEAERIEAERLAAARAEAAPVASPQETTAPADELEKKAEAEKRPKRKRRSKRR